MLSLFYFLIESSVLGQRNSVLSVFPPREARVRHSKVSGCHNSRLGVGKGRRRRLFMPISLLTHCCCCFFTSTYLSYIYEKFQNGQALNAPLQCVHSVQNSILTTCSDYCSQLTHYCHLQLLKKYTVRIQVPFSIKSNPS